MKLTTTKFNGITTLTTTEKVSMLSYIIQNIIIQYNRIRFNRMKNQHTNKGSK